MLYWIDFKSFLSGSIERINLRSKYSRSNTYGTLLYIVRIDEITIPCSGHRKRLSLYLNNLVIIEYVQINW